MTLCCRDWYMWLGMVVPPCTTKLYKHEKFGTYSHHLLSHFIIFHQHENTFLWYNRISDDTYEGSRVQSHVYDYGQVPQYLWQTNQQLGKLANRTWSVYNFRNHNSQKHFFALFAWTYQLWYSVFLSQQISFSRRNHHQKPSQQILWRLAWFIADWEPGFNDKLTWCERESPAFTS